MTHSHMVGADARQEDLSSRKQAWPAEGWSASQSERLYGLDAWGGGFARVGENGHVLAMPGGPGGPEVDVHELAMGLREKGCKLPLVLRFPGVLHKRAGELCGAFESARVKLGYAGAYTAVYPIKVNQNEEVVRQIASAPGARVGLEAGSKAELAAVLGAAPQGATIVCNGYKDRAYIRLALIGQKMGHRVFIVLEKESEWPVVEMESKALGVEPLLGLRVRLTGSLAGKWADSGGEHSKFGLTAAQLISVSKKIKAAGRASWVKLVHVHMGSQISSLSDYERGFKEAVNYYAEVARLGFDLEAMDVGGGLGVDYDGTKSGVESIDYDMQAYAHAVLGAIKSMCASSGLAQPEVFSESGRALTAHHAILLMEVADVEDAAGSEGLAGEAVESGLGSEMEFLHARSKKADGVAEAAGVWALSRSTMERISHAVGTGGLGLEQVARMEALHAQTARELRAAALSATASLERSDLVEALDYHLAHSYIVNFSLFQSMPDAWAIGQIIPVMPIHRLDERPREHGVLLDLTCDSDGRIDRYPTGSGTRSCLPMHAWKRGESYVLG